MPKTRRPGNSASSSTTSVLPVSRSVDPVSWYADEVLSGRIIAGRLVQLACQRHRDDCANGVARGLVWRPDVGRYAAQFSRYLRHSKGEWAGQPIELSPWQEFCIGSVFGWYRADGLRRYRVVYQEIARKNGKSTALASVGIYALVADTEPGAEIYAAATRKEQARIIFDEARRMVLSSVELRQLVKVFKLNLSVELTASKFEPLSSDDRTLDGLNPQCVLVDELHKHKNRALLDVLDTAMGARRQPLLWIITTAGDDNPETAYAQENDYAIKVLEGVVQDDNYFAYIATIDKEDRWDDPACWIKANPGLGVSVKIDDLERQMLKARQSPPAQAAFKRLRLNVRTSATDRAIDMELWARNTGGIFDPATLYGREFYGGLDLSSKIDLSAFVKLFPPTETDPKWRVVARFWMPGDTVGEKSDRDRVQYQRWIDRGLIEATPGNIIDHMEIAAAIAEDCRLFSVRSIAFDTWNATQLAVSLQKDGIPMVEFIQGVRSYNAPTKELLAMLLSGQIDHGSNEVLTWNAHNLHVSKPDRNDNFMPSKKHSIGRIDGMSALIMAIGRAIATDDDDGSSYLSTDEIISF